MQNLDSVFSQEYDDYRIIYIDDCSPDKTGEKVEQYVKQCNQEHRFMLIKNKRRYNHMANHFKAAHMCDNHEIIVHLDGDDKFANENVLQILNCVYQDPSVWLTYGQFMHYPLMTLGGCKPYPQDYIERRDFRYYEHIAGHPRTFRAGLFKHIHLKDFLYQGQFVPCCADVAMMVPMLEMSGGEHIRSLSQVLTYYNMNNPLNIFKSPNYYTSLLHAVESSLRSLDREKYPLLEYYHAPEYLANSTALFLFSYAINKQLLEMVKKIKRYGSCYTSVYIFYCSIIDTTILDTIKNLELPTCAFINTTNNFDTSVKEALKNSTEHYIFILDTQYVQNSSFDFNFTKHIDQLHKTFAIGYFEAITAYGFMKNSIRYIDLNDTYMGWQVTHNNVFLPSNFTVKGALYERNFIEIVSATKTYTCIDDLAQELSAHLPINEIVLGKNY